MASNEHKHLANVLKTLHSNLRESALRLGDEEAWTIHCNNTKNLTNYAMCMKKLATEHWSDNKNNISRIDWTSEFCLYYYTLDKYIEYSKKEEIICNKMGIKFSQDNIPYFSKPLKVLDVGSCYNAFQKYSFLDVLGIDICPANESVFECDFLNVNLGSCLTSNDSVVEQLQTHYYDVVIFCFFLEYIPSSEMRLKACKKAYEVLKPGGLLIIITPDSKHVGANSQIIKCWQFSLSLIGFQRIKYEKFKHMHCMSFRKSLYPETAKRWAKIHKKSYMDFSLKIPQDLLFVEHKNNDLPIKPSIEDLKILPFWESDPSQSLSFSS